MTSKLAQHEGPDAVRAALIQCWIESNDIGRQSVRSCQQVQQFLAAAESRRWQPLCQKLRLTHPQLSLKQLEHGLESLNGSVKRRQQGIVYTPDDVIDYLLQTATADAARSKSPPVICDPACGSGGFLLRAAHWLNQRHNVSLVDAFREYIIGIDRDSDALANARCLAELAIAQNNQTVRADEFRLICSDSLLTPAADLLALAGAERGFDVVASNPPYVKLQNLEPSYRRQLESRYRPFIKGSYSLALLFLIAGHRMLARQGCLAYITQNNLFTSLAGEPVRRYLQEQGCLRRILDFGHAQVFDKAAAYTCLVFLGREPRDQFQYADFQQRPTPESLGRVAYWTIPTAKLNAKKWRLAPPHHLDNLQRIEHIGKPLSALARIRVGFATLKDSAFLVRDLENECLAKGPDGEEFVVERAITRPALKVADHEDEQSLQQNRLRIIFPYSKTDRGYALISEDQLRSDFPRAHAHLAACRDLLDSRDKGKRKAEAWYAWGRTQGRDAPGPKLLTKTFDRRPNFIWDGSDQLFCNGYSVTLRSSAMPSLTLDILQFILNSPVMHYYAKLTSFQIAGGFQCYQKNFIERFGVPLLSCENVNSLWMMDSAERQRYIVQELYNLDPEHVAEITSRE